jgi:pimeloyl-ACP methyl ester carboxylesterase
MLRNTTVLSLLFTLFLSGCIFKPNHELKVDLKITDNNQAIIKGNIVKNKLSSKPIYLILLKFTGKDIYDVKDYNIVDFASLNKPKPYEFKVTKGLYFLYVCQNLEVLKEERYGYEFTSKPIHIKENNTVHDITVELDSNPKIVEENNILIGSTKQPPFFTNLEKMKYTSLNDAIFSRDNASIGLWNPSEFYQNIGGGLYLLEAFEQNKTPIIFIHGMNGTPKDFQTIIQHLDKNKYLPIVYYYATGSHLNYSVAALKYSMDLVKEKYRLKNAIIIAHSMGGLVAKSFIDEYKDLNISHLITLSTPWNGQAFARTGQGIGKHLAESFGNLVPNSTFLYNIHNIELPSYTQYYLLFSYKGQNSMFLEQSNDGIISLKSQLFPKLQNKAYKVYGLNETHSSILTSPQTLELIQEFLSTKTP